MVLFTEGDALVPVPMSFIEDELLWCPDNDGRLVDIASCLDGNNPNGNGQQSNAVSTQSQMGANSNGLISNNPGSGAQQSNSAVTNVVLAAMEQQLQQQQLSDSNNNISSSSSNGDGGGGPGGGGGESSVHCDLANLDNLDGEPEEILRQLAEHPFEIEYFFSDMPGVEVKEELNDMVGYDDSTAFITSSFTPSSPGLPQSAINGSGVSTTTGQSQGRYSISANSLLAEKLMANGVNSSSNGMGNAEGLLAMGQQRPAGKPPDPMKGK